jgi:predicted ribosomally synthesized peptide with SipW-like signal peptide
MTKHLARVRPGAFTRVRAVLAGALVLGVGATMTLATWTDSENATSSLFTASAFDLQSSASTATTQPLPTLEWASHPTAPGITITFTGAQMSPSVSKYSTLNFRTTPLSTVAGTLTLYSNSRVQGTGTNPIAGNFADLSAQLEYRIIRAATNTAVCNAGAFSDPGAAYIAGTQAGAYVPAATVPTPALNPQTVAAAGATPLRYCFDVRLTAATPTTYQAATGGLTWEFRATSDS